jgi:ATP-dependent DNA helicase RecG
MLLELRRSVRTLRGIGSRRELVLADSGILTVADLLLYLPYRYLDRSKESRISELPEGQEVTALGQVQSTTVIPGRRRRFVLTLEDESGELECVWFSGHQYLRTAFNEGDFLAAAGKISRFGKKRQIVHPEVEVLTEAGEDTRIHTGRIIPLYSISARMQSEKLSSRGIRRIIHDALDTVGSEIEETLPEGMRTQRHVVGLAEAVRKIHFPDSMEQVDAARTRLAFEELLCIQLYLGSRSMEVGSRRGKGFVVPGDLAPKLIEQLPFTLTGAQQRVLDEIWADVARPSAMHRLLQGDVGSGKTLVALLAVLPVVEAGAQAVLMAPTEILAEQHRRTLMDLSKPLGISVDLLTGNMSAGQRKGVLAGVRSGETHILVGTHAVLQEDVIFRELGMCVVDEQHRFGVAQRAALREKGELPHLMVMTATPIPRTLALTLYGDLDVTILDELPKGRKPVVTGWRPVADREKALEFLREEVGKGRQGYIVYPAISESSSGLSTATGAFEDLGKGELERLSLGLLHGQLPAEVKEEAMAAFRDGTIEVLICTTVVEVGVDVPNASVMMVEHAERFGLSQLHQLRGRVGRGTHESYCILVAIPDGELTPDALSRLETMARTTDGFEIAEMDLNIRGAGQIFGTRQAGVPEFRFADLRRDEDLVVAAREDALSLLAGDPKLRRHELLAAQVSALEANWKTISDTG